MFVAQVGFAREVSPDTITELLGTWWNNGQVLSNDYAIAAQVATVLLPEESSLDPRHDSEWASRARVAVGSPSITILGPDESTDRACDCSQPLTYVLFHALLDARFAVTLPGLCGPGARCTGLAGMATITGS